MQWLSNGALFITNYYCKKAMVIGKQWNDIFNKVHYCSSSMSCKQLCRTKRYRHSFSPATSEFILQPFTSYKHK